MPVFYGSAYLGVFWYSLVLFASYLAGFNVFDIDKWSFWGARVFS